MKIITAAIAIAVLALTFSLYIQAEFIVDLTQMWIIC
jgi:hypothetical protein